MVTRIHGAKMLCLALVCTTSLFAAQPSDPGFKKLVLVGSVCGVVGAGVTFLGTWLHHKAKLVEADTKRIEQEKIKIAADLRLEGEARSAKDALEQDRDAWKSSYNSLNSTLRPHVNNWRIKFKPLAAEFNLGQEVFNNPLPDHMELISAEVAAREKEFSKAVVRGHWWRLVACAKMLEVHEAHAKIDGHTTKASRLERQQELSAIATEAGKSRLTVQDRQELFTEAGTRLTGRFVDSGIPAGAPAGAPVGGAAAADSTPEA